jgi:glucose/sorbosone dehydrogenase
MRIGLAVCFVLAAAAAASAQPIDPYPTPIPSTHGMIAIKFAEFASIPDVGPDPARMMLLADEPTTRRLFVNDMRGILYSVSYDGKTVAPYLDLREEKWALAVQAQNSERGFQSFAFHPDFNRRGAGGFGRFYTYLDTSNVTPAGDFKTPGPKRSHDTILLEWIAKTPSAAAYDGGAPREMIRFEQPFANHNGGHLTFNPLASPRDADYGLLYVGAADGGSGGDPFDVAQNLESAFGKILRIDPLGSNSGNGKYGIPASNPFIGKSTKALGEIYAYGVRNPQRFFWDPQTKQMFVADIGQNIVEEISLVKPGANLGWNRWEASFAFAKGTVTLDKRRGDPLVTYPVAEYGHQDPLLLPRGAAVTGGVVYRSRAIPQLRGLLIFGDNPSGEIFYVKAGDDLPEGGQDALRRIMFDAGGQSKTLLQLINEKRAQQGKPAATRADLRFGAGPNNQVFILNKQDGIIRLLTR